MQFHFDLSRVWYCNIDIFSLSLLQCVLHFFRKIRIIVSILSQQKLHTLSQYNLNINDPSPSLHKFEENIFFRFTLFASKFSDKSETRGWRAISPSFGGGRAAAAFVRGRRGPLRRSSRTNFTEMYDHDLSRLDKKPHVFYFSGREVGQGPSESMREGARG